MSKTDVEMSSTVSDRPLAFFLGGHDLEMQEIRKLLESHGQEHAIRDRRLAWGARASQYSDEIAAALSSGRLPVLIELDNDLELFASYQLEDVPVDGVMLIDHHDQRAGADAPTSIEQIFSLLDLPSEAWTEWHQLVAANDRGWIPAMEDLGATEESIRAIRDLDRAAQGITANEEEAATRAIANRREIAAGRLMVVELPHDRTSPVADLLHPVYGGPGVDTLLIACPQSVNVQGDGQLIAWLNRHFPESWSGGALPERGFWGTSSDSPQTIEEALTARLCTDHGIDS